MNNYLDADFLSKKFRKSFKKEDLPRMIAKGRIKQSIANMLVSICDVLSETLPEDYWDIQFSWKWTKRMEMNQYGVIGGRDYFYDVFEKVVLNYIYIIFKHDEFQITNSNNETHTIKGLYSRLPISVTESGNSYSFCKLEGIRTEIDFTELKVGYVHSHLPSKYDNFFEFKQFCLGTGDIVHNQSLLNVDYDPDIFRLYLLQIQPFIEWESLEGGPHIQMSDILNKSYKIPVLLREKITYTYERMMQYFYRADFSCLKWTFNTKTNKYEICSEASLDKFFEQDYLRHNFPDLYYHRDNTGQLFVEDTISPDGVAGKIEDSGVFIFKDQEIRLKIEGEPIRASNRQKYLHDKIKSYAKSRIEYHANKCKIREARVKELG